MSIENFEESFRLSTSSCRGICHCGKIYYNGDGDWDWKEGEIEDLEPSGAIASGYTIGIVAFENKEYVNVCECWHERANMIIGFIDTHNTEIAKYLNAEAEQARQKADSIAVKENK